MRTSILVYYFYVIRKEIEYMGAIETKFYWINPGVFSEKKSLYTFRVYGPEIHMNGKCYYTFSSKPLKEIRKWTHKLPKNFQRRGYKRYSSDLVDITYTRYTPYLDIHIV